MGFKQYQHHDYLVYHDLDYPDGNSATIVNAKLEMTKNFRTGLDEEKIVLYFSEFKYLSCTNPNVDALDECFPNDELGTLIGKRIWLKPTDIEVAGDAKQVVRIDKVNTLRMQPDPTAKAREALPDAGLGATPSDRPPVDLNAEPERMAEQPPLVDNSVDGSEIPF